MQGQSKARWSAKDGEITSVAIQTATGQWGRAVLSSTSNSPVLTSKLMYQVHRLVLRSQTSTWAPFSPKSIRWSQILYRLKYWLLFVLACDCHSVSAFYSSKSKRPKWCFWLCHSPTPGPIQQFISSYATTGIKMILIHFLCPYNANNLFVLGVISRSQFHALRTAIPCAAW